MLNNLGLGILIEAQDGFSSTFRKAELAFGRFDTRVAEMVSHVSTSTGQLGLGLGMLTTGVAAVGAAFAFARNAGRFEQQIMITGQLAQATAEDLKALRQAALDAGVKTQFNPTASAKALGDIAQQGFSAKDAIELLIPTLDLAAASLGELDPSRAAQLMTQTMKAFNVEATSAAGNIEKGVAGVHDKLLQAANLFALAPGELPEAVGIASRGATALNQSLDETLISLGLVKNIIPGIERASTGVAVAMERIAEPKVQKALDGLAGRNVITDVKGRFRPFLDIIADIVPALSAMTDKARAAFVVHTFGAHALGAVSAIMTQLKGGIKDVNGNLLFGAEALKSLRGQFEKAAGTAAKFKEAMLNNLPGQMQLLKGSVETLAIALGEPLARIFKPLVTGITDAVNFILGVIAKIPKPMMDMLARIALGAATVIAAFGAFVTIKAGIALAGAALGALGVSIGGILAALGPLVAGFALVSLVSVAFFEAIKKNVGGIGEAFSNFGQTIRLFFGGIGQLLSKGAFSGPIMRDLEKAENAGLERFVIRVFLWVNRIKAFASGLAEGFRAAIANLGPVFQGFVEALRGLGAALGLTDTSGKENLATWTSFGEVGRTLGTILANVAGVLISGLANAIRVVTVLVTGLRTVWGALSPVISRVVQGLFIFGEAVGTVLGKLAIFLSSVVAGAVRIVTGLVGGLRTAWDGLSAAVSRVMQVLSNYGEAGRAVLAKLADTLGSVVADAVGVVSGLVDGLRTGWDMLSSSISHVGDVLSDFGMAGRVVLAKVADVLGSVVAGAIHLVTDLVEGLRAGWEALSPAFSNVVQVFSGAVEIIRGILTGSWTSIWKGAVDVVFGAVKLIVDAVAGLFGFVVKIADQLAGVFGANLGLAKMSDALKADIDKGIGELQKMMLPRVEAVAVQMGRPLASAVAPAMPAASVLRGQVAAIGAAGPRNEPASGGLPSAVTLVAPIYLDSQKIGQATARAKRDADSRSFLPVPATEGAGGL